MFSDKHNSLKFVVSIRCFAVRKLPRECAQSKIYSMGELCNNFPNILFHPICFFIATVLLRFSFLFSVRKIPLFDSSHFAIKVKRCASAYTQKRHSKVTNQFNTKKIACVSLLVLRFLRVGFDLIWLSHLCADEVDEAIDWISHFISKAIAIFFLLCSFFLSFDCNFFNFLTWISLCN